MTSAWWLTASANTASLGRKRIAPAEEVTGGITYLEETSLICLLRWVLKRRLASDWEARRVVEGVVEKEEEEE